MTSGLPSANVKPPPLLIGAALLFWGWQSDLLVAGAIMALVLEAPRWIKVRWDFAEDDFSRIWIFCTLLLFATAVYAFTANEGPSQFRTLFQDPSVTTQRNAGAAAQHSAAALFRWLPMVFFLFMAAQAYSTREAVPAETVALLLRWRWKRERKAPTGQTVNVSLFYFGLCLFSASVHTSETVGFFWGFCALLAWALWTRRSIRFNPLIWLGCLGLAIGVGYLGQRGLGLLQAYVGNLNLGLSFGSHRRHNPFESQTDLGRIGRLKLSPAIVIRLEPLVGAAPPLLREASYRRFNGRTWFADMNDEDYVPVLEVPRNSGTYPLLEGKTNSLKVRIGCYLDHGTGLLPLPSGVGRLENLSANLVARTPLGAVLEDGPGVVVFDALYGPGPTIDSPYDEERDLAVPTREEPALNQAIAQLDRHDHTEAGALAALKHYFADNFSYSTYQPPVPHSRQRETPLTRFLLRTHRGHCEYFATAGVLLLRKLHIPARYAVGYAVHEGEDGKFVVRQRDAHAWCLYWDESRQVWKDIDFTPGSWVRVEGVGHGLWRSIADFWSSLRFEISKFRWGQTHLREYLLWGLVPVLLILLSRIVFQVRRRRRVGTLSSRGLAFQAPGLDSEFYRVEQALAKYGLTRSPSEPLSDWLERMYRNPALASLEPMLGELLRLHYRYRFDPRGLTTSEREALRSNVAACLQEIESLQHAR